MYKLVLLFAALSLAVGAAEVVFTIRGAFIPPPDPIVPLQPELFEAHPTVGYRLKPSRNTTYRYPANSLEDIRVVSNADGFRSRREFDDADSRPKVLVVGDSFVFGQGVREEDRLSDQLESLNLHWRVDNMAMPGWGIDLMIRAIDAYAKKAAPRVVVLTIYSDDFRRLMPQFAGMGYEYSKFELSGSDLITVPYRKPYRWERSRIVQLIHNAAWNGRRDRFDLNEALLHRFIDQSKILGFKPVVAFIPQRSDDDEDAPRRTFLYQWAQAKQVQYFDFTQVMDSADSNGMYIPGDIHWTATGHKIAAESLGKVLGLSVVMKRT